MKDNKLVAANRRIHPRSEIFGKLGGIYYIIYMDEYCPIVEGYGFEFRMISGLELRPQEIRNAMYQGKVAGVIKELSTMPEFIKVTEGKIPIKRMQDRDFICRLSIRNWIWDR